MARPEGLLNKLLRKAKGIVAHRPSQSPDLDAYRRRAAELLERLQADAVIDRASELRLLAVRLAALVEDLTSIGADVAAMKPLVELLEALRELDRTKTPSQADIDMLWSRCHTVLQTFGGRRERFWA